MFSLMYIAYSNTYLSVLQDCSSRPCRNQIRILVLAMLGQWPWCWNVWIGYIWPWKQWAYGDSLSNLAYLVLTNIVAIGYLLCLALILLLNRQLSLLLSPKAVFLEGSPQITITWTFYAWKDIEARLPHSLPQYLQCATSQRQKKKCFPCLPWSFLTQTTLCHQNMLQPSSKKVIL